MRLRRVFQASAAALLTLVLARALMGGPSETGPGPAFVPGRCSGGQLSIEQGVPVLQVAGSPDEIGWAYATLLREQVHYLRVHYLERILGDGRVKRLALGMARPMERHIPERYLREMAALAVASGESRGDVLLTATFLDLYRTLGCSTLVATPPATSGAALLARNLDFPTFGVAQRYSMLSVYHPGEERTFLSVTWPGLPGVISGMNEAGLVLVMQEVSDPDRGLDGIPYQLLYRRVLEECDTVDEAEALIRRAPRTTANNVVLLDGGSDAGVLEVTRSLVVRRGLSGGVLCATNHFRARGVGPVGPHRRYDILAREAARLHGRLGVPQAAELLAMVNQGPLTMQSMIFEPRAMKLHLAFGEPPSTSRPYVEVDVRKLFDWRPQDGEAETSKEEGP